MSHLILSQDNRERTILTVCTQKRMMRIPAQAILYMQKELREVRIFYCGGNIAYYGALHDLELSLPREFCRCHGSYIVNLDYVVRMENRAFFLKGGMEIPISQSKYHVTHQRFLNHVQNR